MRVEAFDGFGERPDRAVPAAALASQTAGSKVCLQSLVSGLWVAATVQNHAPKLRH